MIKDIDLQIISKTNIKYYCLELCLMIGLKEKNHILQYSISNIIKPQDFEIINICGNNTTKVNFLLDLDKLMFIE